MGEQKAQLRRSVSMNVRTWTISTWIKMEKFVTLLHHRWRRRCWCGPFYSWRLSFCSFVAVCLAYYFVNFFLVQTIVLHSFVLFALIYGVNEFLQLFNLHPVQVVEERMPKSEIYHTFIWKNQKEFTMLTLAKQLSVWVKLFDEMKREMQINNVNIVMTQTSY